MRWREIDGFINEMGGKGGVRGAHAEAVLKISRIATPHFVPLGRRKSRNCRNYSIVSQMAQMAQIFYCPAERAEIAEIVQMSRRLIKCPAEIAEIAEKLSNKYIVSSLAAVTLLIILIPRIRYNIATAKPLRTMGAVLYLR